MNKDNNLLYTKEHEWLKLEDDFAYVGITNHAQGELGDIIFVELPKIGDTFNKDDVFGTIEAVKTIADLYIPVDSEIIEINEQIETEPEKINADPYNDGWIVKVKLLNKDNLNDLLSFEEYQKLI
tara:strand:+ start:121 stop:495 length:375 start_codon:yes stop_codon:yes gene_type:complete